MHGRGACVEYVRADWETGPQGVPCAALLRSLQHPKTKVVFVHTAVYHGYKYSFQIFIRDKKIKVREIDAKNMQKKD